MIFPKNKNTKRFIDGFSVVEALFVVGVLALIGVAVWTFQRDVFLLNNIASGGLEAEREARKAMKVMASEIRSASVGVDGSYPIVEASGLSLTFFSDADYDGVQEKIKYYFENGTIVRVKTTPVGSPLSYVGGVEESIALVDHVLSTSTPIFSFFGSDYDGTTDPLPNPVSVSDVRLVRVTIFIDKDEVRLPIPLELVTQVSIRNLKDNY